jgi:hypothetical protein
MLLLKTKGPTRFRVGPFLKTLSAAFQLVAEAPRREFGAYQNRNQ